MTIERLARTLALGIKRTIEPVAGTHNPNQAGAQLFEKTPSPHPKHNGAKRRKQPTPLERAAFDRSNQEDFYIQNSSMQGRALKQSYVLPRSKPLTTAGAGSLLLQALQTSSNLKSSPKTFAYH